MFEGPDDAYAFVAGLDDREKWLLGVQLLRDMKKQNAQDLINDYIKELWHGKSSIST